MISASKEFKEKLKEGANVVNYADFTLSDGTVLHLEPKDFMIGGCTIEDKTTDGKFGVGFVIGKTLTLRIANHDERFSKYDFYNSIINLYVALLLDNETIEKIRKGIYYTLVPETPGDIIEISAVDGMYKLDKDYAANSTVYPATLQKIITDVCLDCGIPIGFTQFDNMSFVVQSRPESATTYRQVLSWACQIAGYNARIDNDGYMRLVWYDTSLLDAYSYTGGNFKQYPHDTVIDGGNFKDYSTNTIISGGSFTDEMPEHIFRVKTINVHTDDVQITGVKVIGEDEVSALFGEEGYPIEISENPFVNGKEQIVANYLGARMVGMVFRPFSAEILNNPLYEPFDVVMVSDAKGNVYLSLLNSISYKIGVYTSVACEAEDPIRNGSTYVSAAAQAVVEARRNTQKQISTYDKAVQNMNDLAANSMGLFREKELQLNGSFIYFESDKPITVDENGKCHFEENSHVWMKSDSGFFSSDDGGKTFTAGYDKNNNAVLNVVYAIGIIADYVNSGRLEIEKNGKTMVLMDFDTGQVILRPDVFELSSGQTIDSIAQDKANTAQANAQTYATNQLNNFVTAVYDPKIASLQSQIDGQIETWYYDYQPTLSNVPASNWKTEADREKHEGDLFYWKSKGYSYRFFKDGSTWKWQIITDSDITKALADASKAQDTADHKRRVFVTTPAPPYDVGDLWFAGSGSDIMTCMTARSSGSYTASDWQKRNKYIDQTDANNAANNAVSSMSQTDVLNKLTNNGADDGIYLLNGKLYISFSAMRGDELTLGGSNNTHGVFRVLDASGNQIGYWSKDGFVVNNKYFAVTSEGRLYANRPTFGSVFYMSTQMFENSSITVETMEQRRLLVMQLIQSWSSDGKGGYSTLYIGNYRGQNEDYLPVGTVIIKSKDIDEALFEFEVWGRTTIYGPLVLPRIQSSTSSKMAVFNVNAIAYNSSSSERYKNIGRHMEKRDVEDLYNISPVWAKYKEGYLPIDDERYDVEFPMFVAEDVAEHAPLAVDHNEDGQIENWNYRVMIPYMFQMIKSQKETIDNLTERLERLESMLSKGSV